MRALLLGLLLPALAACGEGSSFDQSFRNSFREKSVETCTAEARAQIARSGAVLPTGLSAERTCGCAVDRLMEGKSATELMRGEELDGAAQQAAIERCATELGLGGGKPPV
jgi:hypothetical protein